MPYWSASEEKILLERLSGTTSLEELAECLHRSPEAVAMKLRRMGLSAPPRAESSLAKSAEEKEVRTTTTTTSEPIKPARDLITTQEALKMWLGVVKRLNDPNITATELKRMRLILTALKSYIIVEADYYTRIVNLEQQLMRLNETMINYWELEKSRTEDEDKKAKFQQEIDKMKADIPEMQHPTQYHIWPRIARMKRLARGSRRPARL